MKGLRRVLALVLLAALPAPAQAGRADAPALTVFAAASLTDALTALAARFEADTGHRVVLAFDATSRAARQIAAGAPAHVLVAASSDWVDWLAACGPGAAHTRRIIAGNRLVVAVPAGRAPPPQAPVPALGRASPLLRLPRIAIADPGGVPAGARAREALTSLGVWDRLERRVVRASNVRTVLAWIEQGAVDAGIVYASDVRAARRARTAATVDPALHGPIRYAAIAMRGAPAAAVEFVDMLGSPAATAVLLAHGFLPPPASTPGPSGGPTGGLGGGRADTPARALAARGPCGGLPWAP